MAGLLYISLGTVFNQDIVFYNNCFEALKDIRATIIMSVGMKTEISSLENIPSNFIVKNYVPQLKVSSISDLFISHGGMNSVNEALYHRVPLIIVPIQKEQEIVAGRVAGCGVGIHLNDKSVIAIKQAVETTLTDKTYRSNIIPLSNTLINACNNSNVADMIEKYSDLNIQ